MPSHFISSYSGKCPDHAIASFVKSMHGVSCNILSLAFIFASWSCSPVSLSVLGFFGSVSTGDFIVIVRAIHLLEVCRDRAIDHSFPALNVVVFSPMLPGRELLGFHGSRTQMVLCVLCVWVGGVRRGGGPTQPTGPTRRIALESHRSRCTPDPDQTHTGPTGPTGLRLQRPTLQRDVDTYIPLKDR